ncbi:AsmA family protein [Derxia gummosa]|uniref:AsmA family protein n=1 Tax=Derxia gummosa DSM 723 TaxID=1121388 RepID=A0A8B6XB37_9BURK|nr:AsmA family protein [Derxia gummosa]
MPDDSNHGAHAPNPAHRAAGRRSPLARAGRALAIFVALIALLLIALVVFVSTVNLNRFTPWINDRVSDALDRRFEIGGDLGVDWRRGDEGEGFWARVVPHPELRAGDLRIANTDWAIAEGRPARMVDVKELRLDLAPMALFAHTLRLRSLVVRGPSVDLRREQDRNNWTFKQDDDKQPSKWKVEVRSLEIDQGHFVYSDAPQKLDLAFDWQTVEPPRDGKYGLAFTLGGKFRDAPVKGEGELGRVLTLNQPGVRFPARATASVGKTRAEAEGIVENPLALSGIDFRLKVEAESMADLYALTGIVLPATSPFRTEGRLAGSLAPAEATWRYEDFTGQVGQSDIAGRLAYVSHAPRPRFEGEFRSKQLRLVDLGPLIGVKPNQAADKSATASGAPKHDQAGTPGKVLPRTKFDTSRWKTMDVDVKFTGAQVLNDASIPLADLKFHAVLDNGRLTIDPFDFGLAGGRVDAKVALDSAQSPLDAGMDLRATGLRLSRLFPEQELLRKSVGEINGAAAITSRGDSVGELLGNGDGELKFVTREGVLSKQLLELAGLNLGSVVVGQLFGDKTVPLHCALIDMNLNDGVARVRRAELATEPARIDITGQASFRDETLDLRVKPDATGLRIVSLRTPIDVKGTFANPDVSLDKGPLLARAAGAVALGLVAAPAAIIPLIVPGLEHQPNADCAQLLAAGSRPATAPDGSKAAVPRQKPH